MKISDLSKITIKDIRGYFEGHDWESVKERLDLESIKERLSGNPTPIICALAIIITLIAVTHAYNVYKNVTTTQKTKVSELQKQVEEVNIYENTKKQHRDFLANAPEAISGSKMIEFLSNIALKRNVIIASFSPVSKKGNKYIEISNLVITIASESYADMIRFLNDIEKSSHSVRIGKWHGTLKTPGRISQRSSRRFNRQIENEAIKNDYIEAQIEIEIVGFKK